MELAPNGHVLNFPPHKHLLFVTTNHPIVIATRPVSVAFLKLGFLSCKYTYGSSPSLCKSATAKSPDFEHNLNRIDSSTSASTSANESPKRLLRPELGSFTS
ncbi:hypothetical protein COP2_030601 [Malus domestica]